MFNSHGSPKKVEPLATAKPIVMKLAQFWHLHKLQEFLKYLKDTFGSAPLELPKFDCIYVVQAKEGNALEGLIGGLIIQWWQVDDEGIRPISNPDLPRFPNIPENLRAGLYPRPVIKFFNSGEFITIGESFGPDHTCRKTAKLAVNSKSVEFVESLVLWTSLTIRNN